MLGQMSRGYGQIDGVLRYFLCVFGVGVGNDLLEKSVVSEIIV